jgi:hypothetical protein
LEELRLPFSILNFFPSLVKSSTGGGHDQGRIYRMCPFLPKKE